MNKLNLGTRRNNVLDKMEEGSALILFSGKSVLSNNDSDTYYSVVRNFYYLTGLHEEGNILVLQKTKSGISEKLFIPYNDELKVRWTGETLTADEAYEISDIEDVCFLDEFDEYLHKNVESNEIKKLYMIIPIIKKGEVKRYENIKSLYPLVKVKDAKKLIEPLRLVKDEEEIERVKKAVSHMKIVYDKILKHTKPLMSEANVTLNIEYMIKKKGFDLAFNPIVASGANSTVLHYDRKRDIIKNGELVLVDSGCSSELYCADITRTFPSNGSFSERQKMIYEIVLEANKEAIKAAKPGINIIDLNEIVIDIFEKRLKEIDLIDDKDEVSNYYPHYVGHHLGLMPHDPATRLEILEPGNIITIEPGLYLDDEGIGIRIEDDILITEDGCEVLSKNIIKEINDIEEMMDSTEIE